MTFLASRREKPKDSLEDSSKRPWDKKQRRKSTKAADAEAEISRYFMSAKPPSLHVTSSHGQPYQQERRRSRDHESPQAYVDLPGRPFLGFGRFGSCGPNTSISPPIPPTKIPNNTDSESLRRRDSRSPTHSTSYLTWSQSGDPSYASPPERRHHHVAPLTSSKMSNQKRNSPASHEGQHSIRPISPRRVSKSSSRTQSAVSRPSSKHENAKEAPGYKIESRLATGERLRSGEKIQTHGNSGTIELDTAKIPQNTEDLVLDNTRIAEVATHDGSKLVSPPRNQAACQPSGHEPRCEPRAPHVCPLSAQTPIISPHQDPLDDILEALLRECNTNVALSSPASHARSNHSNIHVPEEARILDRTKEHVLVPAGALVNCAYAPEAPASGSNFFRQRCSASLQQISAHDGPRLAHTPARGSLNPFNRSSLGYTQCYPPVPTQSLVDSRNAWNGYDNLFERQREQADLTPCSREHLSPYTAVPDDLSGQSQETDYAAAPDGYASMEKGDEFDDYRPKLYKTLQEGDENGKYPGIRHGERNDQFVDHGGSHNSGASLFDDSHEACIDGIMVENEVNDDQRKEGNTHHEQQFAQGADQHELKHQLFTTDIRDTYSSWSPRHVFSRSYGLKRCAADAQVHDVDSALSGFWTPHKLY